MSLKISAGRLHHISIPLAKAYQTSDKAGPRTNCNTAILELEADNGLVGYGECTPMPKISGQTRGTVESLIKETFYPIVDGENPLSFNKLNNQIDSSLEGAYSVKGAMDIALHDLAAKSLSIPVHQLYGGRLYDSLPVLWPLGADPIDEALEQIRLKISEGYDTFILKAGHLASNDDVIRICEILNAAPDHARFIIDANRAWDVPEAMVFLQGVKDVKYKIDFVEQPIQNWNLEGFRELRTKQPIPISVDESLTSDIAARSILKHDAADYMSVKVTKQGGIQRTSHIARMAESFGVKCLFNSMIELGVAQAALLQLASCHSNIFRGGHCFMSTLRSSDDVTNFGSVIDSGRATIPDTPGLGISLDYDKIDHYSIRSIEL